MYKRVRVHKGAMTAIAERAKRTRAWVWLVLKGEYTDYEVIEAAMQEVEAREAKIAKINQKLNSMTATY